MDGAVMPGRCSYAGEVGAEVLSRFLGCGLAACFMFSTYVLLLLVCLLKRRLRNLKPGFSPSSWYILAGVRSCHIRYFRL